MSLSYNYPPQYAYPSAPPVYRSFPAPPRMHWVWVLVLSVVTVGIFWAIWLVVQARWVKKGTGKIRPLAWTTAYMVFVLAVFIATIVGSVYVTLTNHYVIYAEFADKLRNLNRAVGFLFYIASVYMMKSALEAPPIRIPLHGLLTFMFGPVYFQYYLRKYSVEGKLGEQVSGFGEAGVEGALPEIPPQA